MDQTPIQQEVSVDTMLERIGAKDARIATAGKEKQRFTLVLAVMADGKKILPRIIFKGMSHIPTTPAHTGRPYKPCKNTIARPASSQCLRGA
ncbi:unnamed protein product [Ascophyllum nodosum]